MAFLARKPAKEALLFLRKWLREALRAEDLKTTLRFRPGKPPLPPSQRTMPPNLPTILDDVQNPTGQCNHEH